MQGKCRHNQTKPSISILLQLLMGGACSVSKLDAMKELWFGRQLEIL